MAMLDTIDRLRALPGIKIGEGVLLYGTIDTSNSDSSVKDRIVVGDFTTIGASTLVLTHCPVKSRNKLCGLSIKIGHDVFIGYNSIVLPGVTIGNNTIIGAGSVVTKDIPAGVVAAGNPCKVLSKRDHRESIRTRLLTKKNQVATYTDPDYDSLTIEDIVGIFDLTDLDIERLNSDLDLDVSLGHCDNIDRIIFFLRYKDKL